MGLAKAEARCSWGCRGRRITSSKARVVVKAEIKSWLIARAINPKTYTQLGHDGRRNRPSQKTNEHLGT